MIALLDTSEDLATAERELGCQVEQLLTPLTRFRRQRKEHRFAIDNGSFASFDEKSFAALLERENDARKLCRFVAVPDVVAQATGESMNRMVCQFSCGAASAVATKLTLAQFPAERVLIVNAFIVEEDPDNRRFLGDCEKWFGQSVTVLRDDTYGASTHEVWLRKQYIKGPHGAPCSMELKRKLLATIAQPDDVNVMGYTAEEEDRLIDIQQRWPDKKFASPLIEKGLTKSDCLAMIDRVGIELPRMYRLGYDNANCIGCPKGGQNYWQKIRKDFPEQFVQIQTIQEEIGEGARFLQFRSGPRKGERMWLRDLPPGHGNLANEPSFSCSFFCELAENEIEGSL